MVGSAGSSHYGLLENHLSGDVLAVIDTEFNAGWLTRTPRPIKQRKCDTVTRIPALLHSVLREAARDNGRTVPQEVAYRLEQSMNPAERELLAYMESHRR
jgi:hypothetical protein